MPWSDQGGPRNQNNNPWGQQGGPWGQGPGGGQPPDLEELLRRSQEGLKQILPTRFGGRGLAILVLLDPARLAAVRPLHGRPNEIGLNLIFGKYRGKTQAGLNYNLPAPIGSVIKLAVTDRNVTDVGFREEAAGRRPPARRPPRASARGARGKPDADGRREHRRREVPRHLADRPGQTRGLRLQRRQSARRP